MNPIPMLVPDTGAGFTATVVIAGISIVVGMLLLLIVVFYAFGAVVSSAEKAAKKSKINKMEQKMQAEPSVPPAPQAKATPAPAPLPEVEDGIPEEIVAVISAAVAASEGGAVVRSIRAVKTNTVGSRNPWAAAAVADNTRPF